MRRSSSFNKIGLLFLAVSLILMIGSTCAESAADYRQLVRQALAIHENAQQPIRAPASEKRIVEATDGLCRLLDQASALLRAPSLNEMEVLSLFRNIESQRALLQREIERAQADDDRTVAGVIINRAAARAMADKQKAVDQQFLTRINEILDLLREDFSRKT